MVEIQKTADELNGHIAKMSKINVTSSDFFKGCTVLTLMLYILLGCKNLAHSIYSSI